MSGDKLMPCPFCGEEAEMSYYAKGVSPDVAGHYVECSSCSAGGEPFDIQGEMPDRVEYTKAKAAAAWNTRTNTTTELVEALREIACLDDTAANTYLEATGSYSLFDEPGSVEIARKALILHDRGER